MCQSYRAKKKVKIYKISKTVSVKKMKEKSNVFGMNINTSLNSVVADAATTTTILVQQSLC